MSNFKDEITNLLSIPNITDIRSLFYAYIDLHPEEFNTIDILDIMDDLNNNFLRPKMLKDGQAIFLAKERAGYLKRYLEGKMYNSKEVAEEYVDIQIEHTDAIIKACDKEGERK